MRHNPSLLVDVHEILVIERDPQSYYEFVPAVLLGIMVPIEDLVVPGLVIGGIRNVEERISTVVKRRCPSLGYSGIVILSP
jgi:hypothetical protein